MAKLHFYYSAMNAGKSTTLLQSSHNYQERGMDTLLYAPEIDNRFAKGKITTRIGLQQDAISFNNKSDFLSDFSMRYMKNSNVSCVLVDEAQFLRRAQVRHLTEIVDRFSVPVLTYGIRSDYHGELFEGSQYLLAWADELIEIKTICHCGRKATMNLRIDVNGSPVREGEQVVIGGNETFVATCRKHFWLGQGFKQK